MTSPIPRIRIRILASLASLALGPCLLVTTLAACASNAPGDDESDTAGETGETGTGLADLDEADALDAFSDAICEGLFSCGCEAPFLPPPYASAGDCEADQDAAFTASQAWAADNGLVYDAACAAVRWAYLRDDACLSTSIYGEATCAQRCDIFHGTAEPDESCDTFAADPWHLSGMSTCAQGLYCYGGICADKGVNAQTGCLAKLAPGADCGGTFTSCIDGYYCQDTDDICTMRIAAGESCADDFSGCVENAYCSDTDYLCTPAVEEGEPCAGGWECQTGLCDGVTDLCLPGQPMICQYYGE